MKLRISLVAGLLAAALTGPAWAAVHRLPAAMTTADETPRARHRS